MKTNRLKGFTLIEILVVVGIIGLLIAIVMPSLNRARIQARRVTCATQLHQVALAMVGYLQSNRDRMPYASDMPSIDPAPLLTDTAIYFADVLGPYFKGKSAALLCPDDKPGKNERPAPNTGKSYFESERSSYAYRTQLAGLTPAQFNQRPHGPPGHEHLHPDDRTPGESIYFAYDYWNFHGNAGEMGARRYAYIDGHVGDYEN